MKRLAGPLAGILQAAVDRSKLRAAARTWEPRELGKERAAEGAQQLRMKKEKCARQETEALGIRHQRSGVAPCIVRALGLRLTRGFSVWVPPAPGEAVPLDPPRGTATLQQWRKEDSFKSTVLESPHQDYA